MNTDNTNRALDQVGALLEEKLKQQLLVDNTTSKKGGGDTHKSVNYKVGKDYVEVTAAQSFKYVDQGRGPGKVPLAQIQQWIEEKGIQPRFDNKFAKKTPGSMKRMAFAIRNAIGQNGTIKRFAYKGSNLRQRVYDAQKDKLFNIIASAMELDLKNAINEATKK